MVPLADPPRGKDEGPWPDDVTDLGHSEVFDDSLSEPRKTGKDTPNRDKIDTNIVRQDVRKHDKEKGKDGEKDKDLDYVPKSPYSRTKKRHSSHGSKDEDDISVSAMPRGRHRGHGSQTRPSRMSQERKHSDGSSHRDSPTKIRQGHRHSIDSPRERRRKGSGPHSVKTRHKMPEECVQELIEVLQQNDVKQGRSSKVIGKGEPQRAVAEPSTPTRVVAPQGRHRREPSILKMEDLQRCSHVKDDQQKNVAKPNQIYSSSDDSQSMQTIPVIKVCLHDMFRC